MFWEILRFERKRITSPFRVFGEVVVVASSPHILVPVIRCFYTQSGNLSAVADDPSFNGTTDSDVDANVYYVNHFETINTESDILS